VAEETTGGPAAESGEAWERRLAALLSQARPALLAFVRRRIPAPLRGRIDPEDVVQETLVMGIEKLQGCPRADGEAGRWLAAAARHRLWHGLRRVQREATVGLLPEGDGALAAPDCDTPEAREGMRRLAKALGALPDRARRVLWMRRIEGRSWAEIVRVLDLPSVGAAQQLQRRARAELARRLGGDVG